MTRPTSAAPAWLLEDLGKLYAPILPDVPFDPLAGPARGSMAAARVRRIESFGPLADVSAHANAVLARRGTGLAVELLDGRRGWIERAWEPTTPGRSGPESVTWQPVKSEPWGRDVYAGAAAARGKTLGAEPVRAAAVLDVALLGSGDLVRVEIERVRIPAPASGDVQAFLERKRAPGWKRPRVAMPSHLQGARPPVRGTASRVGIGSTVEIGGPGGRRAVVIEAALGAAWHVQAETGELLGSFHPRMLHNVGPLEPELLA